MTAPTTPTAFAKLSARRLGKQGLHLCVRCEEGIREEEISEEGIRDKV